MNMTKYKNHIIIQFENGKVYIINQETYNGKFVKTISYGKLYISNKQKSNKVA